MRNIKSLLIVLIAVPFVFAAGMVLCSQKVNAATNTLSGSIQEAKSQAPRIDRTTIGGSIAYARYQGQVIEQDRFANDAKQEVLGASVEKGIESLKGLTTMNGQIQVLDGFEGINLGTIRGSIDFAKRNPRIDNSTLKGSIMTAYSQSNSK
ncbi:hypothetical protein JW978_01795 [Candidatus Dojkabacteria bacterium]|nr:hypothetical protein [Candidatus Dojkabacteria bacterium]